LPHPADVARHQELHEVAGGLVALLALHDHFVDVAVVDVADRAFDEVAVAVDERRGAALQRPVANLVPEAGEIVEVPLDLGLGARQARRPDDAAHAVRQVQVGHDLLQALPVGAVRDLPADTAAMRGVGHQHAIAAREAQIGGERRALVASLFLDDLDEQHLAAADHVLDLVAAPQILALAPELVGGVFLRRALGGLGSGGGVLVVGLALLAFLVIAARLGFLGIPLVVVAIAVAGLLGGAQALLLSRVLGFLAQQRLAILLRDLVIVRVDFGESQEAVPVAAVIDERRLQRRFDPRDLG
jgi:hypothetical protein